MNTDKTSLLVKEGWTGPGRCDSVIVPLKPEEDGLHIDIGSRGEYEWWYFDAHLDTGHTIVVFFHASNPNPGMAGRIGVEIVIIRPGGEKTQRFIPYKKTDFSASRTGPDVTIGENYLRVKTGEKGLPVYEIFVQEKDLGCRLIYSAEVKGWKPGTGYSHFGKMGDFAWIIPFVRASVKGTIYDRDRAIDVTGIGYHDHNWLNFQFPRIIDYWMWGRIYGERFTLSYAVIQCNKKMDNHMIKVLMVADGEDVFLSTGEFEFMKEGFIHNQRAKHAYPERLVIRVPGKVELTLAVKDVLEAEDMLNNFKAPLRFIAKNILRLKPGYFRLASDFEVAVTRKGTTGKETGRTLHELVLFKPAY